MSHTRWYFMLGTLLVAASAAVYLVQIFTFHNLHDSIFYMLQDLAFVPIQVLLVMLLIDKLLQKKEKESLLNKLNMMIGVFFSEVGTGLISFFIETEKNIQALGGEMKIGTDWGAKNFASAKKFLAAFNPDISMNPDTLARMKAYLLDRREHTLRMLENPNLLEHDRFTDLLWAIFHLADELSHRSSFDNLPAGDMSHLKGDAVRAYKIIVAEWLEYMKHLKASYPYLYSIAVRTNPFDPDARIEVS